MGSRAAAVLGCLLAACEVAPVAPAKETTRAAITQDPRIDQVRWVDDLLRARVGRAKLNLVFVLDGLRADAIDPATTPNLYALRAGGVTFSASHSVFPTVTRVNASALVTGRYPAANGILGNTIYAPQLDATRAISTGEYERLRAFDQATDKHLLLSASLGELLQAHGKKYAVVSSSGNGCALLLNHRAPEGSGVLINGYLEPGKLVAFPPAVNDAVIARFGHPPARDLAATAVDWAEQVLREYVLPELAPDVIVNWITQPDAAQHQHGARSPEALAAIRNADRNIGLVLAQLKALQRYDDTNIFVLSDHGFSLTDHVVNLSAELVKAGLKQNLTSPDVVVAGPAIHVPDHDPARVRAIAEHLQRQPFIEAVFTQPKAAGNADTQPFGAVPGTFSLAFAHLDQRDRGADLFVSFPWSSEPNRHGARGRSGSDAYRDDDPTGPRDGDKSSHGNLSPADVRNTWFAWGADFKDGLTSPVPVGNVDLLPTLLGLLGVPAPQLDGRVLAEALEGGPEVEKLPVDTEHHVASHDKTQYRAVLQVTRVGRHRYLDKAWRIPF